MEQTKNAEIQKKARASVPAKYSHIPGWGIDMPQERRVGAPKNGFFTPEQNGASWESPEQQETDVQIFVSTERPGITPVFGTTFPPNGMSGAIRNLAYRYSEGKRRHWLLLMLADRVDVAENTVKDLLLLPPETYQGPRKVRKTALAVGGLVLAAGAYTLLKPKKKAVQHRRSRA